MILCEDQPGDTTFCEGRSGGMIFYEDQPGLAEPLSV